MKTFNIQLDTESEAANPAAAVANLLESFRNGEVLHFVTLTDGGELEIVSADINGIVNDAEMM